MNIFTGIGNLGAAPILRTTESGKEVCNFNIAIDRRYYTGQGENRRLVNETDWLPVVVWGGQARSCSRYLQKGSKVAVTGSIRPHTWEDREGTKHNTFEVVAKDVNFLDRIRSTAEVEALESTPDVQTAPSTPS